MVGGVLVVVFGIVLLLGGGGTDGSTPLTLAGQGLRQGTVPAAYASYVAAAGSMCTAAPAGIIAAQIQQESSWDPTAVSSKGAEGISQFMPGTWPHWSNPGESPFDPAAAIPAQARYDCALAAQMGAAQQAGRLPAAVPVTSLMLAAYNAGPAAVLAAGGIPDNGQTPGYVSDILASAGSYADPTVGQSGGAFAQRVIAAAQSQIGVPYAWAGGSYTGPTHGACTSGAAANDCNITGFDCSGLVMYAVYQASAGKIKLPHSADQQTRMGTPVAISAMQPGDIISFTDPGAGTAHHDGIYLGDGQIINAPESGTNVRVDSLDTPYYRAQQWRVVRFS
jgi:cell wall-associated NlpC family hydrolase